MSHWLDFVRYIVGTSVRLDRRLTSRLLVFTLSIATTAPLFAIASRAFVNSAAAGDATRAMIVGAVIAVCWIANIAVSHLTFPVAFQLGDRLTVAFDADLVEVAGASAGLEQLENPAHADELERARSQAGDLFAAPLFVANTTGLLLQVVVTMALLAVVRPVLLLLPLFGLPGLVAGRWAFRHVEQAKAATAERSRLSRHLLQLLTQAGPAKEIRVFGLGDELRRRQRDAWEAATEELSRAELRAAFARSAGQLAYAVGYVGALILVAQEAVSGQTSLGSVLLTAILAAQITTQSSALVLLTSQMEGTVHAVARLQWLRRVARPEGTAAEPDLPVPSAIRGGLELENVSFGYPASSKPVLREVSVSIPAGAVVALVGENGAGKTTLVKLLARLYEPRAGRITLDGVDIARYELAEWRERLTAGFQDFARIEALARETVGVGDVPNMASVELVGTALELAHAGDVVATLPAGLETPLGRAWASGSELSGGQWQKLALGRAMMRREPLLLLLDEPTAALDPHAEHLLFERYAASARTAASASGAITILVSHRFSTVRMAELILVVDGGQIVERGTHEELMANGGMYAELYAIQADAYES